MKNRLIPTLVLAFAIIVGIAILQSSPRMDITQFIETKSELSVQNLSSIETLVHVAFGSDSKVTTANWSFCTVTTPANCTFPLPKSASRTLPLRGKYLNATFSFDAPATCGNTKAEVNLNNPSWYDTADVSLVDGYSNKISITTTIRTDAGAPIVIGPPAGKSGNENVFGVFPYGCDICVARSKPPCGIPTGTSGCKKGSQYKPDVPCQYQGAIMGGGQKYIIQFHDD